MNKVFLGGTCAETTWREELIDLIQIDYFNPVVDDWTPDCIEIENQESVLMNNGDLFVVKKGLKHKVSSTEECHIMLIENKSTEHTGKVRSEITKTVEEQL